MITQAILELYSNVSTVRTTKNDGVKTYHAYDKDENKITFDMSAVQTKAAELQAEEDAKVQAKIDLKASAKAKLIAGEPLTEAEADTLVI